MNKFLVCSLMLLCCLLSRAQEIPVVTGIKLLELEGTKILPVNSYTFPGYYQSHMMPGRNLDLVTYIEHIYDVLPNGQRSGVFNVKNATTEFQRRDGLMQYQPFFERLNTWSQTAKYLLVSVGAKLGEYNFETRTFPLRLGMPTYFNTKRGSIGMQCEGMMWSAPTKLSNYAGHIPCVTIKGVDRSPVAFSSLTVDDEVIARDMKERNKQSRYAYLVLVRPTSESEIVLPKFGNLKQDVGRVMTAEPVALYVFNTESNQLVAQTSAAYSIGHPAQTPSATDMGASSDDKAARVSAHTRLAPIYPTAPAAGGKGRNTGELPTIRLN